MLVTGKALAINNLQIDTAGLLCAIWQLALGGSYGGTNLSEDWHRRMTSYSYGKRARNFSRDATFYQQELAAKL